MPPSGGQPEHSGYTLRGRGDETDRRTPSMWLLSYLRGDDLLEDRSTHTPSEAACWVSRDPPAATSAAANATERASPG